MTNFYLENAHYLNKNEPLGPHIVLFDDDWCSASLATKPEITFYTVVLLKFVVVDVTWII